MMYASTDRVPHALSSHELAGRKDSLSDWEIIRTVKLPDGAELGTMSKVRDDRKPQLRMACNNHGRGCSHNNCFTKKY
jgi:hypothetical protein